MRKKGQPFPGLVGGVEALATSGPQAEDAQGAKSGCSAEPEAPDGD